MRTKISVIIPAYNVAGYIERCLESILAQTFKEFEVIVVDDGSTDDTAEIIDKFATRDSRIRAIHKVNEGVSEARNTGIKQAKGEYLLFFDGDDFVEAYCMEELYRLVKEKNADTIIYGYHRYENGKVKETSYPVFPEGMYQGKDVLEKLASRFIGISSKGVQKWLRGEKDGLYVENPALWRTMVNASLVKENNLLFDRQLKVGEDTIFITDYLSYSKKCFVLHKCYYYLVTRESSTIYLYEKNPVGKLYGKKKLMDAREMLTEEIRKRCGCEIGEFWYGTVVMSAIELAFLLARRNDEYGFFKRYQLLCTYLKDRRVQNIVKKFQIGKYGGIKKIPFLLLKMHLYFPLFLCTTILEIFHYEFQR